MSHFSIVIPAYNRANLITETIESVLIQSHTDFDITIVDDASTDDTIQIVQKYCTDKRVKVIQNEHNLGLTKNWNRCLELTRGPLVQILQSDDLIDNDYLERVNRIFEAYPDVGFISATCRYIDIKGKEIRTTLDKHDGLYKSGDEAVSTILTQGFPHVSSIVMRKSVLDQVGKINEEIWHGPDVEFDTRLASKANYYKIGKVCTSFRRHGTNRGNLEYFRKDYLPIHILKFTLAWSYLSEEGRKRLGISNISSYIKKDTAKMAIGGSILMIAYGKPVLGKFYLKKAIQLYPFSFIGFRYWKALALNLFPSIGQRLMADRLKISEQDFSLINNSKLQ